MDGFKWLLACGALAAGEGLASLLPQTAGAWPFVVIVGGLTALFWYGFGLRGVRYVLLFFLGLFLFCLASVRYEQTCRERPWMRECRTHCRQRALANPVKRDLLRRVGLGLEHDRPVANLNRAILLGERASLPRETKRVFIESGTLHVFAISGLHVMMVAKVIVMALALCLVPYRWNGLLAVPLLWGYVAVIGWSPSAVRAAMMASIYYLAPVFWRRSDAVRAWALTFFIVYLVSPRLITDVGCALSFVVMLSIVLAGRFARGLGNGWRMTVWLTFAAWAAGVPIAAHAFGRVTPGGLLANIPLVFAAKYSVAMSLIGVLVSYVSEPLAAHFNNFAALFTRAMFGVAKVVSTLPGANYETGSWSTLQCVEWYALVFLVLYLIRSVRSRHLI